MMPFWELTLHLILSNRSLLSRLSASNQVSDAGATALGAGLKGSSLQYLYLGECFVFCSERRRHPAVTNDAILGTDVAPYPLEPFASVVIFRAQPVLGRRERWREVGMVCSGQTVWEALCLTSHAFFTQGHWSTQRGLAYAIEPGLYL